jgi:formate dehydrogenase subunit gamma
MSSSDAVIRPRTAGSGEQLIPRYTFAERANHWIGALAYIYLLGTGLAFWSPYLFWLAAIVGGGFVARFWHPWIGLVFTVSFFWMFFQWRGDMQVTSSDRVWWRSISHYIRNEDEALPPTGRFNYGQKLFTWGMFYSTILMLLSGVLLWFTGSLPWNLRYLRYAAILVHASVAMITIGLFLIHVYMSVFLEKGSFGAMVHGTVTRAWARTFHRTWYDGLGGNASSRR